MSKVPNDTSVIFRNRSLIFFDKEQFKLYIKKSDIIKSTKVHVINSLYF